MPRFSSPNPLVSVIIPAYNAARYLGEALDSVRAQSYDNFEIIVVDDGSTDETGAVAQSRSEVRYRWQQNAGTGAARNEGVEMARGELLAFLDSDDVWSPDKLAKQVEFRQSLTSGEAPMGAPVLIYGHARQFLSPDLAPQDYADIRLQDHPQAGPVPGTLLITRSDFDFVGPYSPSFTEGVEWHLRAVDMGAEIHILPEVMLSRRIHRNNKSRAHVVDKNEYVRVIKAALDRRRALAKALAAEQNHLP